MSPATIRDNALRRTDVQPRGVEPGYAVWHDVLVLPELDALYMADGRLIETSKRVTVPPDLPAAAEARRRVDRGFGRFTPPVVEVPLHIVRDDREPLFVGASWPHYGHFITDAMSRLWALDLDSRTDPLLFLGRASPDFSGPSYARAVADALGITGRLFSVDQPTLFRRVVVPEPAIQHAFRIYHAHARPHAEVARRICSRGTREFDGRDVYLSRSGLAEGQRRSPSEMLLEEHLRTLNVMVVRPEVLSMSDQVALFNGASLIAGTAGSAFHTELFSLRGDRLRMLILTWEKVNNRFPMIDAIVGSRVSYVSTGSIISMNDLDRVVEVDLNVEQALSLIRTAQQEV